MTLYREYNVGNVSPPASVCPLLSAKVQLKQNVVLCQAYEKKKQRVFTFSAACIGTNVTLPIGLMVGCV